MNLECPECETDSWSKQVICCGFPMWTCKRCGGFWGFWTFIPEFICLFKEEVMVMEYPEGATFEALMQYWLNV